MSRGCPRKWVDGQKSEAIERLRELKKLKLSKQSEQTNDSDVDQIT